MSKTYIYLLVLMGVYLFIVKGLKLNDSGGGSSTHVSSSGRTHGGRSGTFTDGGRSYSSSGGTF